jgi:outer membrane protein OmpA-like peptidoglycan-associated protein
MELGIRLLALPDVKSHFLILFGAFLALQPLRLAAQQEKGRFRKGGTVRLEDSLSTFSHSGIFEFPNVNRIPYYKDEGKYRSITNKFDRPDAHAYEQLKEYVSRFGIQNFSRDVNLLWSLAILSETYGPPGESVLLYKLVLKHDDAGFDYSNAQRKYDSLKLERKEDYVPLQYYYDLVDFRKEVDTLRPPRGVLISMGELINSDRADYGPTMGNRDDLLLFTSKRNSHLGDFEGNRFDEDLFFTQKEYGEWSVAREFANVNSSYNEGSACLSHDGRQLIFARCNSPDGIGNCDLFSAELRPDSTWGNIRNLGKPVNSTGWDSHPSLTHSGDTLYFASNRAGGFGYSDIYYSVRGADGKWMPALNAGPIINTKGHEVSPFYHHRFNVLYFSSNGHPLNFGEFDIYKAYYDGVNWGEPRNIGPLVNGGGSEYYFTIDAASQLLYYARAEETARENMDLFGFPLPMEAQPEARTELKGTLTEIGTGKAMTGIVSVIDLDQGIEVAPKFIRDDGTYDFRLINRRNYLLIIQGDAFFRIQELFYLDGDTSIVSEAEPIASHIQFQSLEFEPGDSDILPAMHADLGKVADFLIDHPSYKLKISGHTDSQGNEISNLKLSQDRADAIKDYLVRNFPIVPERVQATGYGSSKPIIPAEKTEADRQMNRRVEFELVRKF